MWYNVREEGSDTGRRSVQECDLLKKFKEMNEARRDERPIETKEKKENRKSMTVSVCTRKEVKKDNVG